MKKIILLCCLLMAFMAGTCFALEEKPAQFVVLDRTGQMTKSEYRGFYQMVKMNYHFPYYKIQEDNSAAVEAVKNMLAEYSRPAKAELKKAAEDCGATALVVLVLHRMDQYMISSWNPWEHETYVRTNAYADMYAYNADGDKYIRKFMRESDVQPMGLAEDPAVTIKWKFGNMLNQMEGRPQI